MARFFYQSDLTVLKLQLENDFSAQTMTYDRQYDLQKIIFNRAGIPFFS